MNQLFILLAFVACAFAVPIEVVQENSVEEKFNSVNATMIDKKAYRFGKNMFEFKIGNCTYKEFVKESVACEREFFMSFREENSDPCSLRLEDLKKCALDSLEYCMEDSAKEHVFEEMKEQVKKGMSKYDKYYCSDKLYSTSEIFKAFNMSYNGCAPGFAKQLDECQAPVMEMFKNNRGNTSLCRKYEQAVKCFNRTVSNTCEFNFGNTKWIFNRTFNPFCDAHQRNETEEDWDHEDTHDLLGHDYDDHDDHDHHDHDHDDHDHDHKEDHDDDKMGEKDDHDHDDHHDDDKMGEKDDHDHDDHHDDHHDDDKKGKKEDYEYYDVLSWF